jgi:hypothetical protein
MTAANVTPFFIGRPEFQIVRLAWFVSTYRATETYDLEYTDRPQYTKMKKHLDSLYDRRLMMSLRGVELVNEALDIRISRTEISKRRPTPGTSGRPPARKRRSHLGIRQIEAPFGRIVCIEKLPSIFFEKDKAIKKLRKICASGLQCDVEVGDDERLFIAGFQSILRKCEH